MNKIDYPDDRYNGESPWLDKNWLYKMYVVNGYTSKEIANMYGCRASTITTYVSRYNLEKIPKNINDATEEILLDLYINEKMPPSLIAPRFNATTKEIRELFKLYNIVMRKDQKKSSIDNFDLYDLYINKGYSINKISKMSGSNRKTVTDKIRGLGIDVRDIQESQLILQHGDEYSEIYEKIKDYDWLYDMYITKGISSVEIGSQIGCDYTTIIRQLRRFDIEVRDASEAKIGLQGGDKHPNWKGGITELHMLCRSYFFDNIRDLVLQRDCYSCQICKTKYSDETLHVHHLYRFSYILNDICEENSHLDVMDDKWELYNIIIAHPLFNEMDLLITLCESCHWYDAHKYKMRDN